MVYHVRVSLPPLRYKFCTKLWSFMKSCLKVVLFMKSCLKVVSLSVRRGACATFWGGATLILLIVLYGSSKITKRLPSKRVGKLVKRQVFKFGDSLFEGNVINNEHLEEGFWNFFVTWVINVGTLFVRQISDRSLNNDSSVTRCVFAYCNQASQCKCYSSP